jgi:hypothetical protein
MSSTESYDYIIGESEILPGGYLVTEVGFLAACVCIYCWFSLERLACVKA